MNRARIILAVYLGVMFAALPFLPGLATWVTARLGAGPLNTLLRVFVVCCVLLPALNLFRAPRPRPPLPHLAYAGLVLGAAAAVRFLVSSPIAQVHLAEYALLAVLILLALPSPRRPSHYIVALVCTALTGVVDEVVQHFVPKRVFDPYDVALNAAAAALGVLAAAWWAWVGNLRRSSIRDDRGEPESG